MNLIKFFLLATLIITPFYAQAALIKASDFEVGTEISQLDSNTTISLLQRHSGITQLLPVFVEERSIRSNPISNDLGGMVHNLYMASHDYERIESLDDLYASPNGFSAIQINYITPTRQITVNGLTPWGDGFMALAFGKNGEFLEYQGGFGPAKCLNTYDPYCIAGFSFGGTVHFENAAYYVVIGGMFSETYIESIDASLPEPSPLLLLALGGIVLTLRSLNTVAKNHITPSSYSLIRLVAAINRHAINSRSG